MTTCLDLEKNYELHKRWIEKYKYHLEILKKDHELIVKKRFKIFFAVDFYDIYEYCFPYDNILGKLADYKDMEKRRRLMELQFARSFLFYGTETRSKVLLPPYASEVTDFFKSRYYILEKYRNDDLKRDILNILFRDQNVQDILRELEKENGSPREETELLTRITRSSSDIFFLLSSGFLEGLNVLNDLFKKRTDSGKTESYRIVDPEPSEIKCYNYDVRKVIGEMENSEIERMFTRRGKYLQNRRDAKALQYIVELNKRMEGDRQAIFLASNADYMKKIMKNRISIRIKGEEYDPIRDCETLYVYLIEIRDIGFPMGKGDQKKILEKIESSLGEFERFSKLSQHIPALNDKCMHWEEEKKSCNKLNFEDECPFSTEVEKINESLKKVEELRNEIENINLMKQIDVVLSPLFSEDRRKFLKLEFRDLEDELLAIFEKIRELVEDRDQFVRALEKRENQLEDQTLQELFNVSFDSLSVQEPFTSVNDVLLLIRIPFRLRIHGGKLEAMFKDIRQKAVSCRDQYLETGEFSEKSKRELNESLRELAKFSWSVEDERKYIIWQIVFLCNKRFDLVRIWNKHYKNQVKSREMKRESDYLFCLACYFDIPKNEELFKDLEPVCMNHIEKKEPDLRFYHIFSLALLRLFEDSPIRKRFGYARENLIDIFKDNLMAKIGQVDEEFQIAIKNNYCYAVSLVVSYLENRLEYRDQINEAMEIMREMKDNIKKEEWLYNMEDTLGNIYFLLARYFEEEKKIEYALKAKECFENAEKFYLHHERKMRKKNMRELDRMLENTSAGKTA